MNVQMNPFGATGASASALAPPMRTSAVQADIVKPANMATLPQDQYNMLAQFGGLGYAPPAFDPTGSNGGYYGNATYIRSPLMQKYLQPTTNNSGAWVTNALANAMPGWNAVSTPGQNPYYTASQSPSPLFPTNIQGGGAVNPVDLPGVNGNPYSSMWPAQANPFAQPAAQTSQQAPSQQMPAQAMPQTQGLPGRTTLTAEEASSGVYAPGSASAQPQAVQDWLARYIGSGNSFANNGGAPQQRPTSVDLSGLTFDPNYRLPAVAQSRPMPHAMARQGGRAGPPPPSLFDRYAAQRGNYSRG